MRGNWPCSLAWYTVSAGNIRNNTHIQNIKIPYQRTLYFRTERNCEHIRNVCLASSGTVIAAQNRVHLANARRGPDLLDYEG